MQTDPNKKEDVTDNLIELALYLLVLSLVFVAGWDTQKSIGNIDEMKEKIKIQSLEYYISNLKLDINGTN